MLLYPCTISIHGIACEVANYHEHMAFLGQLKFGKLAAQGFANATRNQKIFATAKWSEIGFDAPLFSAVKHSPRSY